MGRKRKIVYITTAVLFVLLILGLCFWHSQKATKETEPETPVEEPKVVLEMDLPVITKEWIISDGIFGKEEKLSPKAQFMEDTFNHEINLYKKEAKAAERISFSKAFEKSNLGEKTVPTIKAHHDSLFSTFE
jgi:hypothetical protein